MRSDWYKNERGMIFLKKNKNGQFPEKIIKLGLEPSAICPARF